MGLLQTWLVYNNNNNALFRFQREQYYNIDKAQLA